MITLELLYCFLSRGIFFPVFHLLICYGVVTALTCAPFLWGLSSFGTVQRYPLAFVVVLLLALYQSYIEQNFSYLFIFV